MQALYLATKVIKCHNADQKAHRPNKKQGSEQKSQLILSGPEAIYQAKEKKNKNPTILEKKKKSSFVFISLCQSAQQLDTVTCMCINKKYA